MSIMDVVEAQCVRNFNVKVDMFPLETDLQRTKSKPWHKWEFQTRICFNGEYAKYFAERKILHIFGGFAQKSNCTKYLY